MRDRSRRAAGPQAGKTGETGEIRRDSLALSVLAVLFASALGLSSVALPLRALDAGYGAGVIGVLVAVSALVQILSRSRMGAVMRRITTRGLLGFAPSVLAVMFVVVLVSPSLVALALAWVLLALGRACFWTVGQTHSVRGTRNSMRGIARLNFYGSLGALSGPILAGLLTEFSVETALAVGAALAAIAVVPAVFLERFPPFARSQTKGDGAMWRRPGVDVACRSGVTAGAWRGLMDGYVPVVLESARNSSTLIGVLVAVANATSVVGTVVIGKIRESWTVPVYVLSMLAAGGGLALIGFVAGAPPLAAVALGLSGLGAGVLQTLGPNLAAISVGEQEKGDAMATYGTARTSAMFMAPLAVAGGIAVVPVSVALLVVSAGLALPAFAVGSLRRITSSSTSTP
jgi:MFS family permease